MDDFAALSPQEERVVGIHVMGPNAADVVQGFAVAMKCGLTKRQLDATVGVRPSSAQVSVPLSSLFHQSTRRISGFRIAKYGFEWQWY